MSDTRFIHLLYVPTMNCNLKCKYCYLGDSTKDTQIPYSAVDTLAFAVDKLAKSNVAPFNISLHGGEVTTLSIQDFHDLAAYIDHYYMQNGEKIRQAGFPNGRCHIKTNLYDIRKHLETIQRFAVSVSGSLDLPLRLHEEYRVTKDGRSTLQKILANISALEGLAGKLKVSSTIFKQHFSCLDEIVDDLRFLEANTCLDMNDFNFMVGFDYNSNSVLTPMSEQEQVALFERMHREFDKSSLDRGVNGAWFSEFTSTYCAQSDNCGETFFLLERNGDVYSCVRGQGNRDYYYGNIYSDSIEDILNTAKTKILINHNREGFCPDCAQCGYLYVCKTGCPFVKNAYHTNKSYTCRLQQAIYQLKSSEFPSDKDNGASVYRYVSGLHPALAPQYIPVTALERERGDYPSLEEIINGDPKLKFIYDPDIFSLTVDDRKYRLESQILRSKRDIICFSEDSEITLYIRQDLLEQESQYPQNNSLYIILLSGETIEYGDERRQKQRHIMTHQVYTGVLERSLPADRPGHFSFGLGELLRPYKKHLSAEIPNNLLFTTGDLRDCHYAKQKENAYYHIQAINLPFQNIEFYYTDEE